MFAEVILWPNSEIVEVADKGKLGLSAWGLFNLGEKLKTLEWAIATMGGASGMQSTFLAGFVEPLRIFSTIKSFESIGDEATWWHNQLSNQPQIILPERDKNNLRNVLTRWQSIVTERTRNLYLVTPDTMLKPEKLLIGVAGVLTEENITILSNLEIIALNEACKCILMQCPTAAEFSALRAAESLLRRWYEKQTGKKIQGKTWGAVLDRLVELYPNEKQRPKEIVLLDYLRLRRNEVNHPEMMSSQQDAETTLMTVCSNLIAGIQKVWAQLPDKPPADSQLSTPSEE